MVRRFSVLFLSCLLSVCAAGELRAQTPAPAAPPAPGFDSKQWRLERISPTHLRLTGQVEVEGGAQVKFFADEVDIYTDKDLLVATGNVVFTNPEGRISAERIEFNTKTRTGTFFQASGILSLGVRANLAEFAGQDPDVYFYGDTVEKLSERKYKITRGGFTTCVQPTPRWEMATGTLVLNLDDYAVARNTVLRVKGVPLMYLPLVYYPIQEDERATGILMPTYGTSTLRGQSISNAFFWAINRSHDATFFHDWFTRTGQGAGAEYRYIAGYESQGTVRVYRLNQKAAEFKNNGRTTVLPETRSFQVTTRVSQQVAKGLRARSQIDYFSDVITQQLYHQNLYQASRSSRVLSGGLSGNWGAYATTFAYDRNQVFSDARNSFIYGSTPRGSATVAPQRLFGPRVAPVYGSATADYGNLLYRQERDGVALSDRGLTRFDVAPAVRVPISRWTFVTLNTSASYRLTRYSESVNASGVQVLDPYTRAFWNLSGEAVGPVLTKIWDAAADSSVERYKHVIEPTFGFHRVTNIPEYRRAPILTDSADFVVGGSTRFTYGLANRLLLRPRPKEGVAGSAREFLSIALQQTYYTNAETSQYDPRYASSQQGRRQVNLSPVAMTVRFAPTLTTNTSLRLEQDVSGDGLKALSVSSDVLAGLHQGSVSLSRTRASSTAKPDMYLSGSGRAGFLQGRATFTYALSWDIARQFIVSQSMSAAYLAQCCGFAVDFQNYNFPRGSSFPIPSDRRLNFSFTLAGLGTFSNFFGAFGAGTQR